MFADYRRKNTKDSNHRSARPKLLSCILGLCMLPIMAQAEHTQLPGLRDFATILTPPTAVPTVVASNELDMFFMQGYLHARDRFFQMDSFRRIGSGTMAELVGAAALPNDIQLRTFGLRRAAWETYAASSPASRARIQAYANGVNAWLAEGNLPSEYGALELTQAERWDPVDTLVTAKLIAFSFDMDLGDIDRTISVLTYQGTGDVVGFDGTALFFEDTHRVQPPDDRLTVPGFLDSIGGFGKTSQPSNGSSTATFDAFHVTDSHLAMAEKFYNNISGNALTRELFNIDGKDKDKGSNWWLISGDLTDTGASLIASDPHSSLSTPSLFYPMHLSVQDDSGTPVSFAGTSIAGTPALIHGCNNWLCWGSTVNPIDAIDIYTEELRFNSLGLPTHTVYQGQEERIIWVYQSYYINQFDGVLDNLDKHNASILGEAISFVVPRRNNGPIISLDTEAGTALSLQYTGFGPTFELEAVIGYSQAETVTEFGASADLFDIASQNWGVVDIHGNIGYFALSESPIREDFQTLMTADGGIPPIFIRDGTGTLMHEWMPTDNPLPHQALPTAILPPSEMPQLVNPASGYIVNANNDPVGVTLDNNPFNQVRPGGGLYYLNAGYVAYRMGRIDRLMQEAIAAGPVSIEQFKAFQSNNQMLDAELVMPHLMNAWENAFFSPPEIAQFVADSQLQEVFGLFAAWDFSTPTGIAEGYDPGEDPFALSPPTQAEIDASVAATVWAIWRGRILANTIDGTLEALQLGGSLLPPHRQAYNSLKYLLDTFDSGQGVGASGISFFNVPGLTTPAHARDFLLLFSLREALDLLASDEFAPAFANSTEVMDYRWGKLHRIVFEHTLGDPFSLPNGLYGLSTVEGLQGVARSGGYEVLDASSHSARSGGLDEFMFGSGPFRRFVGQVFPGPLGIMPEQIIPGGQSGILGSPLYANQLYSWLVNAHLPLFLDPDAVEAIAIDSQLFGPPGS